MTKNRNSKLLQSLLLLGITIFSQPAFAQMVGTNAYIKATSVEIGVSGIGGFEGCDVTVSPPLTGMHYRSGTQYFGFVANPQVDSWATFDGDFFTPGSPENGWGFEIGTAGAKSGNNCSALQQINGAITNWTHNFSCYSADWEGDATSGTDLHFKINYFLQESDLYYTTTVSVTNNTTSTIPEMYYYRNLDPDNNQPLSGDFYTTNTIVSQPGTGCNLAHVSATQTNPWNSYLGLAAIGANWRASYGGFANRDASDLWSGAGFVQATATPAFVDEAIALSYKIENLAPGATETFKFVVILDDSSATNAINNLLYFTYPGAAGAPAATCSAVSDTVRTCGGPVPINVNGSNVSDYTWTWSPSTGLSTTTGLTVIANPGSTTVYTASGTPLSSCLAPVVMSVVVEVTPSAGANPVIAPVPPLCISSPAITLTADSLGGVWTGGGITNATTGAFDPIAAGIGSHLITYTTPGFCNTVDTVLIVIDSAFDATITQPPSICISGAPVNLSSATSGGTWSGIGITSGTSGTFDPTVAGLGFHTINYAISGICASNDSVVVEVTNAFDATITQPANICQGSAPITLSAAHTGGVWTGIGITDSINGTFTPSTVGTQTIAYMISGACGDADTVNITVLATPDVTPAPAGPFCLSDPAVNLTADTTGGVWSGPGITNSSLGTFNPAVAGLGVHYIIYTTATTICPTTDTLVIYVNSFSNATIAQPPSQCISGPTTNFFAVTPGGTWAGTGITNTSAGAFDPALAGLGFHVITYSIGGMCAAQDTMVVEVTNLFNVTILQPNNICQGSDSIMLYAAHPGGVWSGTGIIDSLNGIFDPAIADTTQIVYTISGACGNTDTVDIVVLPAMDATITAAGPVCSGSAAFNMTGAMTGGVWSGTGITDTTNGTFNPVTSGSGTFVITYAIAGTCGDTATQNVTVNPLPSPNITVDNNAGCAPLCVNFTEGVSPTCNTVHYDFGDGDTSNVSNPSHCFVNSGLYTVTITCTDMNGCVGTTIDSGMVDVFPVPVASFTISPSPTALTNQLVTFNNTSTSGTSTYWVFGDSSGFGNGTTAWSPTHYYMTPGNFCATLISYNAQGCRDTATACIDIVDPLVMIPNFFTPNGDNQNDVWRAMSEGVGEFNCGIYDRWGLKMTEWEGIENGWDGRTKAGSDAHDGTYFYLIRLKLLNTTDEVIYKGYLQLAR